MASLTEHTLLNGLEENLKDAIEDVGGKIPHDSCIWKYPEIIRQQLVKNTIDDLIIKGTDGIKVVEGPNNTFTISADRNAEHVYVDNLDAPDFSEIDYWASGTSVQTVLEDLMNTIIPSIPTITKGDVILTNEYGQDLFSPVKDEYTVSLAPNTYYLRLFVYYQKSPIYISLDGFGECDFSNYYTIPQVDGLVKSINSDIDVIKTELSNSVKIINLNHDNLKTIVDDLINKIDNNDSDTDNNFDEIFQSINNLKLEDINIQGSINNLNDKFNKLEYLLNDTTAGIEIDIQNLKLKDEELLQIINDLKLVDASINNSINRLNDKVVNDINTVNNNINNIKNELSAMIDSLSHIDEDLINKIESEIKRISDVIDKLDSDYKNDMAAMDKVHIHLINDAKYELNEKIQDLEVISDQKYATKDLVNYNTAGLMSPVDKIKLDNITTIVETEISNIFNN